MILMVKIVLTSLHPALVNYFVFGYLLRPCLLPGNMRSFNLCLRRGTALNPLTIVQFLYPPFFLKFSNLSLTGKFGNTLILPILSLIASMAFVKNVLLVIFFPYFLTLGPPLFGVSVNLSLWP